MEKIFDDYDVIVIDVPVAGGKSFIGQTIARWAMTQKKIKSRTLVPTNILVEQMLRDFSYLHTLPAAHTYTCSNSIKKDFETGEVYSHSCSKEKTLGEKKYCSSCPYMKQKKKGYAVPYGVYNIYTYMANQYYRPLLIIDEAHNLLPTLRELNAKKYWQADYGFPSDVRTYSQLYQWLKDNIASFSGVKRIKLEAMLKELEGNKTRFIVQKTFENFRGEMQELIKMLPVDVRDKGGILWPSKKVTKLVLMSATINKKDIEGLGLDKRRVAFLSCPSAIPKERRPLYLDRSGINLAWKHQDENFPKLTEFIRVKLAERPNEKGLIHVTYSMMDRLKVALRDESRLLFHDRENKMEKYKEFVASSEPKVLVAAGLYEGIDLPEDLGRWQILTKIPFPSLESPAISWMAENDPEWYANETVKVISQAYGRICRTPTDKGDTFIVDSSFQRLYTNWGSLFPEWVKEAVVPVAQPEVSS